MCVCGSVGGSVGVGVGGVSVRCRHGCRRV